MDEKAKSTDSNQNNYCSKLQGNTLKPRILWFVPLVIEQLHHGNVLTPCQLDPSLYFLKNHFRCKPASTRKLNPVMNLPPPNPERK